MTNTESLVSTAMAAIGQIMDRRTPLVEPIRCGECRREFLWWATYVAHLPEHLMKREKRP